MSFSNLKRPVHIYRNSLNHDYPPHCSFSRLHYIHLMTSNEVCHTTMNLYSHFEIAFIYAKHITLDIAFEGEHKFQNIVKI